MVDIQYARTEDGVNIAYTVEHNGPGTPVMCPLAAGDLAARQDARDSAFEGRTVVKFDPRCQGLSDRHVEDVSLPAREFDFLAVQRAVGVEKLAINPIAQQVWPAVSYAFHNQEMVSHLAVVGASASGTEYWTGTTAGSLRHLAEHSYEAYTEAYAWLLGGRAEAVTVDWVREEAAKRRANMDVQDFLKVSEADLEIDVSEELQGLTCRVLVSSVSDITLLGIREVMRTFAARVPNARLVSPRAHEQWAVIARFIDEEDSGPRAEPEAAEHSSSLRAILFTDIEGHTEMMARLGDERGRDVLRDHERITRDALKEHGGTEVKAMGDGFMSWFPSATAALRCAASLQKAFESHSQGGEPIRVRAGINAGEPMEEDDDLFGTSVIVAARTAASAAGGQIVVTDVVRQLVAGKEFLFADRGLSNLKGFEDPVRTWEVLW